MVVFVDTFFAFITVFHAQITGDAALLANLTLEGLERFVVCLVILMISITNNSVFI
jgi:hypothetical protein